MKKKGKTHKVQISVYSVNVSWWGGRSVTEAFAKEWEGRGGGGVGSDCGW